MQRVEQNLRSPGVVVFIFATIRAAAAAAVGQLVRC